MTKARDLADLLADGAVGTDEIADDAVTLAKLGGDVTLDVAGDTTPQLGGDLDTNGNDINVADNDRINIGADSNVQIYHDGSNSWIKGNNVENNTLTIGPGSNGSVLITNSAGQNILSQQADAAHLHYAGVTKLATTSSGIDVTGTVTADGVTSSQDIQIETLNNSQLELKYSKAGGGFSTSQDFGAISFQTQDGDWSTTGYVEAAAIALNVGDSYGRNANLVFRTGYNSGLPSEERMRISGTGDVIINGNGNDSDFRVESNSNTNMLFVDSGNNYISLGTNATDIGSSASGEGVTYRNGESLRVQRESGSPIILNRVTDDGSIIDFRKNGAGIGSIGVDSGKLTLNSGGSNLVFQTGGTSRVNMDNSQMYPQTDGAMSLGHPSVRWNNLRLTGAINFDSSSAGLDAYEEGTWTAYISDGNGNNPVSGGTLGYVRIGNVMYLFGQASFVNVNAYIGGSQAFLWTPTAPRNAFAQSSNDAMIPAWHSGTASSMNYWDGGYPSISMSTGNTRHPLFRHKYSGADSITGANLGSGDFRVNFNGFFYYE